MVKLIEIYETTNVHSNEVEKQFSLRETFLNPDHVVCVREDLTFKQKLQAGEMPQNLDSRQRFSKIYMDRGHTGIDIVVVGAPEQIYDALNTKKVLKG
tara:strand:- start:1812 stop:2105 length:294 start_codon:yes stop_codon:yes gene_type:complete